jgi:threonine synthase
MKFISTRNTDRETDSLIGLLAGADPEGGLLVPSSFPAFGADELARLADEDYPALAAALLTPFADTFRPDELEEAARGAYAQFEDGEPAPLIKIDGGLFVCELWHGPTFAFKDIALTLLPRLLTRAKEKTGDPLRTLVLTATSGDTGKAALEGFRDIDGVSSMVFYPADGVSTMQRLQMCCAGGRNVNAVGIRGNFDDAQRAVKALFADGAFHAKLRAEGARLYSANSINAWRLLPQIVYYFSSYAALAGGGEIEAGQGVNFCVPTGNFGNILAGYYARKMGLPINRLICASNRNDVLTDFFNTGVYDAARPFYRTSSPSMDILVSSNVERLIFELSGRDSGVTAERMTALARHGKYAVTPNERTAAAEVFSAYSADEAQTAEELYTIFNEYGYIADTHTAVAFSAARRYAEETGDTAKTVILGTASPYKFPEAVLRALKRKPDPDVFKALRQLETRTALPIPAALTALSGARARFTDIIDTGKAAEAVMRFAARQRKELE